jgi:hypothetical protein
MEHSTGLEVIPTVHYKCKWSAPWETGANTMKGVACFICIVAISIAQATESQKPMKYSVLAIEYIGASDKPVSPIVISDSEAGAEWYRSSVLKVDKSLLVYVHVVNATLLEKLIAEVELFIHNVHHQQEKLPESAKSVSVTIITPQRKDKFMYDADSAISFLDNLQKQFDGDESLRSDLLHFQNRIRHLKKASASR